MKKLKTEKYFLYNIFDNKNTVYISKNVFKELIFRTITRYNEANNKKLLIKNSSAIYCQIIGFKINIFIKFKLNDKKYEMDFINNLKKEINDLIFKLFDINLNNIYLLMTSK